ncbi:MAG: cyclic nucleotide-binding domain-containing protein [Desulfobulbaceae bacterium]|nr:cyclic nucleotide-binding domain-containing protein [Desulfobulbaceae bacterium]
MTETNVAQREAQIFQFLKDGNKNQAKEELANLVIELAKQHNFTEADRLRDRIYEIDAMALNEIIRTGEVIDEEKAKAIGGQHKAVWEPLLTKITEEEFTTLYHATTKKTFSAEAEIVSSGSINDALFFINRGTVEISHYINDEKTVITELHPGKMIGENFFEASLWTVNVNAKSEAEVGLLHRKDLDKLSETFPGLESKLRDFYNNLIEIQAVLAQKEINRRAVPRYETALKVFFQFIDKNGKVGEKPFRADLIDISEGGVAFAIRISKKENCRILLGRTIRITIPLKTGQKQIPMDGRIISVQPFNMMESDYGIHVRLSKRIPGKHLSLFCDIPQEESSEEQQTKLEVGEKDEE